MTATDVPAADPLLKALAAELLIRDPGWHRHLSVTDYHDLARQTIDQLMDSASLWQEHLGPLYDAERVREMLAQSGKPVSRQAVSKRRNLLALRTGSGRVVYPAFQFQGKAVVPGLEEVLAALPEGVVSRWTLASWLVSPDAELDGDRPIDVLREGAAARVVDVAQHWAAALAA
jgi:hypothetical protein